MLWLLAVMEVDRVDITMEMVAGLLETSVDEDAAVGSELVDKFGMSVWVWTTGTQ